MENVIFYHGIDNDGYSSAAIAKEYSKRDGKKTFLVPVNYGWYTNKEIAIGEDVETVFLLDFTFQGDEYREMEEFVKMVKEAGKKLVWIDHHKSAIEGVSKIDRTILEIPGIRDTSKAACVLTWNYLFSGISVPTFIQLFSDYDIWNKENPDRWLRVIYPFQLYAKSQRLDPWHSNVICDMIDLWLNAKFEILDREVKNWINSGLSMMKYEDSIYQRIAHGHGFVKSIKGIKTAVCMSPIKSSDILSKFAKKYGCDMMMIWSIDKSGLLTVSLYSENPEIDCSKIAEKLGKEGGRSGGGHRGAAGFQGSREWFIRNLDKYFAQEA
ncbi:MAG: hypothetical protein SVK08_00195 [Halobacteriota archaeon]|nr:hypothetical protein [Halobacteriota archaeon]